MNNFEIEILETSQEQLRFILSNCEAALANSLRRIMLAEVPSMAIHIVNVFENNSVLND
jgi:DNA-directed RNA polymerase alpha subunit